MTNAQEELLADLLLKTESASVTDADGYIWRTVYLPNAQNGRSKQKFGGLLKALKDAGHYRPLDDDFGEVRMLG
jgi:hypothetical protein